MNLYSYILQQKEKSFLDNSSFLVEMFSDSVLDYLSLEIYQKQENLILVNSIDYLCSILEESESKDYFTKLLSNLINTYNHFHKKQVLWIPSIDENHSRWEENSFMISYYTGIYPTKDDFVFAFKKIVDFSLKEKFHEK